jgi:hypothetical protein
VQLDLKGCISFVDAFVGNTTMQVLLLSAYDIASNGLPDVTRLVKLTRLSHIDFRYNLNTFDNNDTTWQCIRAVFQSVTQSTILECIYMIDGPGFGDDDLHDLSKVNDIFVRDLGVELATALLVLQPGTRRPIGSKSGLWPTAFAELATTAASPSPSTNSGAAVPGYPGASAIFKILHARPGILEKQLR